MSEKLQPVAVERDQFELAFGDSVDMRYEWDLAFYLDRASGDVLWVFERDRDAENATGEPAKDNRKLRKRIAKEPDRYLEIPPRSRDDDHEMLRNFLDSKWTHDEALRDEAWEAYTGSIKRWKRDVPESAVLAFRTFEHESLPKMGEEFLRENGIEPEWR